MPARNAHCSYCGARFGAGQPWPRACARCGNTSYINPLPVALLLLPVEEGLVVVRRGEPPVGALALPGGYVDQGETWQEAAAREMREEAGISVDPAEVRVFDVQTAREGFLLIFGIAAPRRVAELPSFAASAEIQERLILREPAAMAFPLHEHVTRAYFAGRRGL